jgi:hypothetical protein
MSPARIGMLCGGLAMLMGVTGCWIAALQLAPIAVQAVETVGYGVLRLAAEATMHSSSNSDQSKPSKSDAEDARHQACASLEMQAPLIIEFHTDSNGSLMHYRELTLEGELGSLQWQAVPDPEADAHGWRPATHFAQMAFQPPINSWLKLGESSYIAYTPESNDDLEERDEYNDLVTDFGPRFGTFHWQGNIYDYGVLPKLPCFPAPRD